MRKPEHQWQTKRVRARRQTTKPTWTDDPRAECFVLEGPDAAVGWAELALAAQRVDARSAEDPELVPAVSAWLIARGRRAIALSDEQGRVLASGPLDVAALDRPPRGAATRLVTLAPSNLDAVEALGCLARVVACEDSSELPPHIEGTIERLGPDLGPDLDRVAALAPELVVASLSVPGMERVVSGLRARDLPLVVLAPRSLADMLADLERLGAALGVEPAAAALVEQLRGEIDELARAAAELGPPRRVYLEWWPRPMFTPGADCFSNELIALAGGRNVFGERAGASLEITPDELLAADPELCFVSWCGVAADKLDVRRLIDRPGLDTLAAARAGHVHPLDERFAGRPGPRMLEAARMMARHVRSLRDAGLS